MPRRTSISRQQIVTDIHFCRLVDHVDMSMSLYLAIAFTFNFVSLCLCLYMIIWEYNSEMKDGALFFASTILWLAVVMVTLFLELIIGARVNSMVCAIRARFTNRHFSKLRKLANWQLADCNRHNNCNH